MNLREQMIAALEGVTGQRHRVGIGLAEVDAVTAVAQAAVDEAGEVYRSKSLFRMECGHPRIFCRHCYGEGRRTYPNTTRGHGGIGGQMICDGPCDGCNPEWGSPLRLACMKCENESALAAAKSELGVLREHAERLFTALDEAAGDTDPDGEYEDWPEDIKAMHDYSKWKQQSDPLAARRDRELHA